MLAVRPLELAKSLLPPHLTWRKREKNPLAGRIMDNGTKAPYFLHKPIELFRLEEDCLTTFAGFTSRLHSIAARFGVRVEYEDLRTAVVPEPDKSVVGHLRAGQDRALETIWKSDHGVIVCPTAWGKTEVVAKIVMSYPTLNILVVSPSKPSVKGLYDRLKSYGVDAGIVDGSRNRQKRVTVCSAMSMKKIDTTKPELLLFDEVHRSPAKNTRDVLATVINARMFGLTASDDGRSDNGEIVTEALFGLPICTVEYEEAVAAGSVAPMFVVMMDTRGVDSDVTDATSKTRHMVWRNTPRNEDFATVAEEVSEMGQTLMMTGTIEHALNLRKLLPGWPVVYGSTPKVDDLCKLPYGDYRMNKVSTFLSNEYTRLVAKQVFTQEQWAWVLARAMDGQGDALLEFCPWMKELDWKSLKDAGNYNDWRAGQRSIKVLDTMGKLGVEVLNDRRRADLADRFGSGELQTAIATHTWSTAVDFPRLQFIFRTDGLSGKIMSTQIPGRAARIHEDKECGILLDSQDKFNDSMARRSKGREREYRSKKWTIIQAKPCQVAEICRNLLTKKLGSSV